MKTPCSDYQPTKGVIFFARMLDKLRLREQGKLPPGYNVIGCGVWVASTPASAGFLNSTKLS